MKKIFLVIGFLLCLCVIKIEAQLLSNKVNFTYADTLRGTNGPGRDWWDVNKYDLHVNFNIKDSTINGYNIISFNVLKKGEVMQIDLQEPLILDSIVANIQHDKIPGRQSLDFKKEGNAYFFSINNNHNPIFIDIHCNRRSIRNIFCSCMGISA